MSLKRTKENFFLPASPPRGQFLDEVGPPCRTPLFGGGKLLFLPLNMVNMTEVEDSQVPFYESESESKLILAWLLGEEIEEDVCAYGNCLVRSVGYIIGTARRSMRTCAGKCGLVHPTATGISRQH